jgi:hypothetical protein
VKLKKQVLVYNGRCHFIPSLLQKKNGTNIKLSNSDVIQPNAQKILSYKRHFTAGLG